MKQRLMLWIDMSFLYFGLAESLQRMFDCELFSIIEITENPKKFFQKQKIVDFKKSWFYHDNIKNINKTPDLNYLKSIENKYGINLWLIASNDRMFNYMNKDYNFSDNQILSILEQECKFYERVLDEVKPDFMLMLPTHQQHNHIFYEMCEAKGITVLISTQTRLGMRIFLTNKMDPMNPLPTLSSFNEKDLITNSQKYLEISNMTQVNEIVNKMFLSSRKKFVKAMLNYILSTDSNVKTHYSYFGRTKFKVLCKRLKYEIESKKRESFMNNNLRKNIQTTLPFIYFPLHQEIERALLLGAPFHTNQLENIKNVSKSLPIGYKLIVKEHPHMKYRGWRSISEIKQIMSIPNVELVHHNCNSIDLIKNSQLVFTINGSASIEAAMYGKPSIILSNTGAFELPSMHKVNSWDDLPFLMRKYLNEKVKNEDILRFINAVEKNSILFDDQKILQDFQDIFYDGGFLANKELSEEKIKNFLKNHQTSFDSLAELHIRSMR